MAALRGEVEGAVSRAHEPKGVILGHALHRGQLHRRTVVATYCIEAGTRERPLVAKKTIVAVPLVHAKNGRLEPIRLNQSSEVVVGKVEDRQHRWVVVLGEVRQRADELVVVEGDGGENGRVEEAELGGYDVGQLVVGEDEGFEGIRRPEGRDRSAEEVIRHVDVRKVRRNHRVGEGTVKQVASHPHRLEQRGTDSGDPRGGENDTDDVVGERVVGEVDVYDRRQHRQ